VQRFAGKVRERLLHLERQVRDMLIFVKGDVRLTDLINTEELLLSVNQALEVPLEQHKASLVIDNQCSHTQFFGNRDSIVGAIMNLLNNAMQASGNGAELLLQCRCDNNQIILRLRDNGPGLNSAAIEGIQEPFFTTKSQGTGLGLQVVRAVVEAHHGNFELNNHPDGGAQAIIILPVAAPDMLRHSA
jgi:two-component system sensor histidine kinase FlrB